jgi:hypothetical protein
MQYCAHSGSPGGRGPAEGASCPLNRRIPLRVPVVPAGVHCGVSSSRGRRRPIPVCRHPPDSSVGSAPWRSSSGWDQRWWPCRWHSQTGRDRAGRRGRARTVRRLRCLRRRCLRRRRRPAPYPGPGAGIAVLRPSVPRPSKPPRVARLTSRPARMTRAARIAPETAPARLRQGVQRGLVRSTPVRQHPGGTAIPRRRPAGAPHWPRTKHRPSRRLLPPPVVDLLRR